MSDTAIRITAFAIVIALIEFMACCYLYDQWDKQKKRADHWRAIAKEQADNPLFEVYMVGNEEVSKEEFMRRAGGPDSGS